MSNLDLVCSDVHVIASTINLKAENHVCHDKLALLQSLCSGHDCFRHPFFSYLEQSYLSKIQIAGLLKNYDAHASVLRRLLLKAASRMPEKAVGFVLENVRNEYGNGNIDQCHQLQLLDLVQAAQVSKHQFASAQIEIGTRKFIKLAVQLYCPPYKHNLYRPAIIAGAITATEILAQREFMAMKLAFSKLGLKNHIWFDHVGVEAEHTRESMLLANYFIENHSAWVSVQYGLMGMLDANLCLYDGLLAASK